MADVERTADAIAETIDRARTDNKLEAMWSPELLDPAIPMTEPELDDFLTTFAQNKQMRQIEDYIRSGNARCETHHPNEEGVEERCTRPAIGTVDFYGMTFGDSVIVCREDVRPVYKDIMANDVGREGLTLALTINGKAIPRIPEAEQVA